MPTELPSAAKVETSETRRLRRVSAWLKKADAHWKAGHRFRAVWYYKRVLTLDAKNVAALVNLGLIFSLTRGKHPKARVMLSQALALEPDNPTILLNLGTLQAQIGDLDGAMNYLERAKKVRPNYPDLHYNMACLYAQRRQYEDARREVEEELRLYPGNLNAKIMQQVLQERMKADEK